jgi:hypothetical protein
MASGRCGLPGRSRAMTKLLPRCSLPLPRPPAGSVLFAVRSPLLSAAPCSLIDSQRPAGTGVGASRRAVCGAGFAVHGSGIRGCGAGIIVHMAGIAGRKAKTQPRETEMTKGAPETGARIERSAPRGGLIAFRRGIFCPARGSGRRGRRTGEALFPIPRSPASIRCGFSGQAGE